ncbi:uncharacterized protein BDZ99DRAFT_374636 [Mytilinidion resinicola]|uniref:Uncharacterized protein n=1 Tax=Mytilinidion resinicola TaxID=574789 RepID=A0A6A6Z8Y5_9PEZI|nr:uncharacterized protein BDZ99DRAFT_374636 [Mytilinidion resinicola]KAF2817476.1 hypothetical protein BDZ99DRAFT_374636 [Mytilinidion resinicola]
MSLEPPFSLKHTNVSRPQLLHSDSKQSITASEDFYSLSDPNSSESDDPSKLTNIRFQTPPSRFRTPQQSHERVHSETTLPTVNIGKKRLPPQTQTAHLSPTSPTFSEKSIARKPVPTSPSDGQDAELRDSKFSQIQHPMDSESLSTTPGMDDTPYIRFAIDQLTRDEEVRGSRQYTTAEDEDYPVDRIVSDEGLGYGAQERDRQRRISRGLPPRHPQHTATRKPDPPIQRDIFVPYQPSPNSFQYPPLNFMPGILRPVWLGLYLFLCLLMLAGLIFCAVYSNQNQGLWEYISFGDNRYFVFEYLPTLFGIIILIWLFQIQIALQRTAPFIAMASESQKQRSEAVFLELYPMQFLLPKLEHFRAGQPVIGVCYVIFWLFSWTIPLLASSFNVRYHTASGSWRWIAVQGVIWTTAVLYILLILALTALGAYITRKTTGLKWDPRSIADIIALLERSNIMNDYSGSETFVEDEFRQRLGNRTDRIGYWHTSKRTNDIFYGIGEEGGATRRYSIEQGRIREKAPERQYPAPGDVEAQRGDFSIRMDIRSAGVRLRYLPWYLKDTFVIMWIVIAIVLLLAFFVVSFVNSKTRYGFLPQVPARANSAGFSASNFLFSFVPAVIAHFLFLAFLSLDYSLRALQPYASLSAPGGATAEASLLADYPCRLPLSVTVSAIANRHFRTAFVSLVSLTAATLPVLAGGCFWTQFYPNSTQVRVAAHLPAYYALCFFLALYAISLFALLPDRRRAALPHRASTLAEIISWLYQSQILTDRAFARPYTKADLVTKLMGAAYMEKGWAARSLTALTTPSRRNLQEDEAGPSALPVAEKRGKGKAPMGDEEEAGGKRMSLLDPGAIRYGFGIHVGRDGLEHLGIDRVKRGGQHGREMVLYEEQRREL